MSKPCGDMKVAAVKVEPPDDDACSLDAVSTVKTEPADCDDVYSPAETIFKEEMDVELTVIRPPDYVYMLRPCKREPAEDIPIKASGSVEAHNGCESETSSLPSKKHQTDLRRASADRNDSVPLRCDICNKSFKFNSHLEMHSRIHTGERPFNCDMCDKTFTQRSNLKSHMLSHTGQRPFTCDVCDKSYPMRATLVTHMKIHTGERPFKCEVCNKGFTQRGNLLTHMKIHTTARLNNNGNKRSGRNGKLKRHSLSHMGERPFDCEVCSKCFANRGSLMKHMQIHKGDREFICFVCKKCFLQRRKLVRHMKIHKGFTL